MSMLVVAVTGRSGSGKSTVAEYYETLGYPVADGDQVSRAVTGPGSPCLAELAAAFGPEILAGDGTLLRGKLAQIAFATKDGNARLVEITHRYISREIESLIQAARANGERLFFVDGAVIVGWPIQSLFDKIIVVTSGLRLSISRIILRDGISKASAYKRLEAQPAELALLTAADFVIENNAGMEPLLQKADAVLRQLLAAGEQNTGGAEPAPEL